MGPDQMQELGYRQVLAPAQRRAREVVVPALLVVVPALLVVVPLLASALAALP